MNTQCGLIMTTKTALNPTLAIVLTALLLTFSANMSFLEKFAADYLLAENYLFLGALLLLITSLNVIVLSLVYCLMPLRWAASLIVVLSVLCGYFSDQYGVIIDADMIRNTLETNIAEASDLFSWQLLARLLLFAALPISLLHWLGTGRAVAAPWWAKYRTIGINLFASLTIITLCAVTFSAQFSSFIRQHKQLRYYINPIQPIYASIQFGVSQFVHADHHVFTLLAGFSNLPASDPNRELIIMVVGETARADHFGLLGYQRNTTPLLSKQQNLIAYSNIRSCGTSTAISVPCMFALAGRQDFLPDEAKYSENSLDILAKAGVSVLWRDNNSDSKGVAVRQPYEDFKHPQRNPLCDEECRDVGLLSGLQDYIDQQQGDILIVLHQMGSHGPAYYKRYPRQFEQFTPTCQTAELSDCSAEQINNAYDNTVVYTDYFLNQVIELLKANTNTFQASMLYVSDHGESLGENGIYLHGLPYAFAPDTQKQVPVLLWSDEKSDIDLTATRQLSQQANSHDAIAAALIRLFEVQTDAPLTNTPPLLKFKAE